MSITLFSTNNMICDVLPVRQLIEIISSYLRLLSLRFQSNIIAKDMNVNV